MKKCHYNQRRTAKKSKFSVTTQPSKYNPIERYWARLQLSWSGLIINNVDKLIEMINKVKWKGVYTQVTLVNKEYKRGISIDKEKIRILERRHVYRENGIEKWSLIITP